MKFVLDKGYILLDTAKKMIENNYSNEENAKILGLSISKINLLRKEM